MGLSGKGTDLAASTLRVPSTANATAIGRVSLALLLLYFALSDPDYLGGRGQLDNYTGILYLAAACALLAVSWVSWWWDFRLRWVALGIDAVVVIVLEHHGPTHYGYFTLAMAVMLLILLGAGLRFGRDATVRAAIFLNFVGLVGCLSNSYTDSRLFGLVPGASDNWMDVRHVILTALLSIMALWMTRHLNPVTRLPRFVPGEDRLVASLAYATRVTGARRGLLCWKAKDAARWKLVENGADGAHIVINRDEVSPHPEVESAGPAIFDAVSGRGLALSEEGRISACRISPGGVIGQSGLSEGLLLPISCTAGHAWLVIGEYPPLGWDLLRAAPSIASEIAHGLDRDELERTARSAAVASIRNSIARDLHDSVAQSLAGAGYWLQSLQMRKGVPDDVREDLKQTKQALDRENASIRSMIDRLRGDIDIAPRNLGEEVSEVVGGIAPQWRLKVDLTLPKVPLVTSPRVAHEIQQIVREGLANAARHGSAGEVGVALSREGEIVSLVIDDNGTGFPPGSCAAPPRSISERTASLGGVLTIGQGPQGGRVRVELPMEMFR